MRKLLFVAAIMAVFPAFAVLADATPGSQGYRLDVGDQLRIKVFEWRSQVGDVHEWTALDGDYAVDANGAVAMPLLGALKAVGTTTDQLADTISNQLQSRFGLSIRPQASIEIIQYRPFYILGDVSKPGEYPYQPGLTVLQAVSIAGGRYRVHDPALLLTTAGDLRVYRLQYNQLLARRARLQAELDDANAINFPPELLRRKTDPNVAQLIEREQSMFAARRDAMSSELNALNQLKTLLNGEVASLQDKMKNMDQQLALMKQELSNTTNLVQQGLAVAPREYTLRETELDTEGRRLDLDAAALRAKEDIGKADQAILELRNKTRDQTQADLADAEQKLSETAARIATGTTIVDRQASTAANPAQSDESAEVTGVILRREDGKTTQVDADEGARVEPGDTIKILPAAVETPETPLASSAPVPAVADDPPPEQAVTSRPAAKPGNAPHPARSEPKAGARP